MLIKIDLSSKKKRLKIKTPSSAPSSLVSKSHLTPSILIVSCSAYILELVPSNLNYSLILWSSASGRQMERWNKETDTHNSNKFMVQGDVWEHGQGGGRIKRNRCSSTLFQFIYEYHNKPYHGETTGDNLCIYDCT